MHEFENRQEGVLSVGGYSLSAAEAGSLKTEEDGSLLSVWSGDQGSLLQPLTGFSGHSWEKRLDDSTLRTHLRRPFHATVVAHTSPIGRAAGETGVLVALAWTGTDKAEAQAWTVVSSESGQVTLAHPDLGNWTINHELIPQLSPSS